MRLRYTPFPAVPRPLLELPLRTSSPRHHFHHARVLRDEQIDRAGNHYETLKLHPQATHAEIKKSFYKLSKAHHPDHNRSDPHAPKRFMRISEAYSILSSADKRAKYDRDVLRLHHHQHHHRRGSYSSSGPAGGRPASGLSRRRTTFTGPPPSFFRSGGWGGHSEKRRAAHEESTGSAEQAARTSAGTGTGSGAGSYAGAGTAGGMGPGQSPFRDRDEVPHFDKEGHERTGRRQDERRARRRMVDGQEVYFEPEGSTLGSFILIGGIILVAVGVPAILLGSFSAGEGKPKKKAS